jgi:hypothetical protein
LLKALDGRIENVKPLIQRYILNFIEPNRRPFEEDRRILKGAANSTLAHMSYILGSNHVVARCAPTEVFAVGTVVCICCESEVILFYLQSPIEPIHEYFEVAAIIGVLKTCVGSYLGTLPLVLPEVAAGNYGLISTHIRNNYKRNFFDLIHYDF